LIKKEEIGKKLYVTSVKILRGINIMSKTKYFLALLVAMVFIAGCSRGDIEKKGSIKIAINIWPGYAHAFIAKEKGYFKKNRVEVELLLKKEVTDSLELYREGKVDGIFTIFPDVIILNSEGILTKIVYVADYSDAGDVIIGKPQYKSLADLAGKTVSFEGINTFSHLFVLKSLEKAGLKESDLRFEIVKAQDVLSALENGRIDAGHTWEPIKSAALRKGYKIIGKAGDVPGIITDVLAFDSKIIEQRPDDIRAIVKSILEARDFLYTNREEALRIIAPLEDMTEDDMDDGIKGTKQPDLKENEAAMKETEKTTSLHASGKIIADFYLKRGQLSSIPNFNEIIEPRFVNELAAERQKNK
jgi:NitT/TauT family transport system substrate-binding protein